MFAGSISSWRRRANTALSILVRGFRFASLSNTDTTARSAPCTRAQAEVITSVKANHLVIAASRRFPGACSITHAATNDHTAAGTGTHQTRPVADDRFAEKKDTRHGGTDPPCRCTPYGLSPPSHSLVPQHIALPSMITKTGESWGYKLTAFLAPRHPQRRCQPFERTRESSPPPRIDDIRPPDSPVAVLVGPRTGPTGSHRVMVAGQLWPRPE